MKKIIGHFKKNRAGALIALLAVMATVVLPIPQQIKTIMFAPGLLIKPIINLTQNQDIRIGLFFITITLTWLTIGALAQNIWRQRK
ncbi:MAG: hypothetical protein U9O94_08410 [Nanoarchaeota archaeon]|nr:hypothetical protein [Nanoarchaeota archaeon]